MKTAQTIWALLLVMALPGTVFVQSAKPAKALLLETGEGFRGAEVNARSGEKWLGLYVSRHRSFLAESTLTVRRVFDAVLDEEGHELTGKSVSVNRRDQPIFLVKNASRLRPGRVTTVYSGGYDIGHSLAGKTPVTLRLGGQSYQIKVVSPRRLAPEAAGLLPADAKLLLTTSRSAQTLYALHNDADDLDWYLLWAGDADGDGRLDLYLSLSSHYNVTERKLFLSSAARAGQLVRQIAEFVTTGC